MATASQLEKKLHSAFQGLSHCIEKPDNEQADSARQPQILCVAFSGGMDSAALAHALVNSDLVPLSTIHLVHVHHGLQSDADDWVEQGRAFAADLGVEFASLNVSIEHKTRTSLEAQARAARYQALHAYCIEHNGLLLLAHHADDQIETVLLQLKRGAGPKGLSAMAPMRHNNGVVQLRPWLEISKRDIEDYVRDHQLTYVDDPSNTDTKMDRNFLRQQIIPQLQQRWPGLGRTVARSARLCAQQQAMIDEVADDWLRKHAVNRATLPVTQLLEQSQNWQQAIIRRWISYLGFTLPSEEKLSQFLHGINQGHQDTATLTTTSIQLKVYEARLYLEPAITYKQSPSYKPIELLVEQSLKLFCGDITLIRHHTNKQSRVSDIASHYQWSVGGSDKIKLSGITSDARLCVKAGDPPRRLKRLLKDWRVPPWKRNYRYLLTINHEPIAVIFPGHVQCLAYSDSSSSSGPVESDFKQTLAITVKSMKRLSYRNEQI